MDSDTTELKLNQLRVIAMAQILYERTLERVPGNTDEAIHDTVLKFGHYVNLFGNVPTTENISKEHLTLRMHVYYFIHHVFFYVFKAECVNHQQEINRYGGSKDPWEAQKSESKYHVQSLT